MLPKHSAVLITLVSILGASGCASVPMAPDNVQAVVRHFAPLANKSRIYVVRPGQSLKGGAFIGVRLDGQLMGRLLSDMSLVFDVEPGRHEVSGEWAGSLLAPGEKSRMPSHETARQDFLPGKCYFFSVTFGRIRDAKHASGVIYVGSVALSVIPDEEGRRYVNKYRMVEASRVFTAE